jgi:hypothetical protein
VIPLDIDEVIRLLQEIKNLEGQAKKTVKQAKTVVKKAKRAPSAYNQFMKKELAKLRKKHPRTKQTELMKKAARAWKRSAERKRSMK